MRFRLTFRNGSGSLMNTVSTSVRSRSYPNARNALTSWIFSRPILWKFGLPQPKSLVVRPLDIEKVLILCFTRTSSIGWSMAPTR